MTTATATPARSRLALPVILAAQLVIPLSIAGTAVALPQIAGELGSSPGPLQWVVNGFNVAFALLTIVWGALADRFGQDRIFTAGITIVLVASVGSALAPTLLLLDAARVLAGVGAAAVLTGATAILSNAWQGTARARAFALFGTINGLGLALGPTVCGIIVQLAGWRGTFWFPAAVLAVALLGSRTLPRVRVGGTDRRLFDPGLLRNPGFTAMVLVPVAGAVGFVTFLTYLPAAFAAIHGWSPGRAGATMLLATLPVIFSPSLTAAAMRHRRIGIGTVIAVSIGCLVLGAVGMLALAPGRPVALIIAPMILIGLGFGLPLGIVDGEALSQVPVSSSGTAAGLLNLARIGSEAVAVAAYAAALAGLVRGRIADPGLADRVAAGGSGGAAAYADALHTVALIAAAVVFLLGAASLLLFRHRGEAPAG
ncbi:putative MFS family arabinose efflux permease [Propionibacteriaceae bacterium ES.041]|uniref:MFS transporter n=1 Tax=Enemella evansiae TaxID=2016499 RepID=A0A255GC47_9ACTN|nr:MFS transporter [Enemella evansiae]OYO10308.1 MFS transporter [Enemella evansiae]OYO13478.1 MFS transporter [Enemella evansiae]PFG68353.1 putative MFS family arabinose efflux permease [Propionibacteriaceae bacterium ES.041]TDO87748.1 putative MFS family arabinose efflux permease [Enemella evansiae]